MDYNIGQGKVKYYRLEPDEPNVYTTDRPNWGTVILIFSSDGLIVQLAEKMQGNKIVLDLHATRAVILDMLEKELENKYQYMSVNGYPRAAHIFVIYDTHDSTSSRVGIKDIKSFLKAHGILSTPQVIEYGPSEVGMSSESSGVYIIIDWKGIVDRYQKVPNSRKLEMELHINQWPQGTTFSYDLRGVDMV